jgi:hypothetical protein
LTAGVGELRASALGELGFLAVRDQRRAVLLDDIRMCMTTVM